MRRRVSRTRWTLVGAGALVIFAVVLVGAQFLTRTGIFHVPGVVYYDESLSSGELAELKAIFADEVELDKDVTISAYNTLALPELEAGEYLYKVLVPVTDFYDTETGITADSAAEVLAGDYELIDVQDLDFSVKLLAINDRYYLDEFSEGAVYRIVSFKSEAFEDEIEPLVAEAFEKDYPRAENVLTFAQTGVTALSRGMNAKLNQVGNAEHFAEGVGEFLSKFDLTHTSNEASFTELATADNICSDLRFIKTLLSIGLDIVELTGNHNQDCGDTAALDTIDMYAENGIKVVGGGKTAAEAAEPLTISEKGTNITMLAFNESTGGATLDDTPGANQYYEEIAAKQIKEAKARGDFVIVDMQYYECSMYVSETEDTTCDYADSAAGDQVGLFRQLIDLGADVVVGTSAHQPQTYELYGDGVIYYGLGNLFFDQAWWPGTTRSLVLAHYFYNGKLLQTKVVPTVYNGDLQTKLLDEEASQWFLERLISERP